MAAPLATKKSVQVANGISRALEDNALKFRMKWGTPLTFLKEIALIFAAVIGSVAGSMALLDYAMRRPVEDKIAAMDKKMDEKFSLVDKKFENIDKKFENIDKKFELIDNDIKTLIAELRRKR